jgi:hypothetical protein
MHQIIEFAKELGVNLYEGQAQALDEYYTSGKPNWLLLCGRRSGKSLLSDLIAIYEAVIPDFTGMIRPGEQRFIMIVSVRQDNASLHINNIGKLMRHDRGLGKMIKLQTKDRIELNTGVTILSLPASARAGRGYGASTVIMDELAFFTDTNGDSSADQVYDAYSPTLATFGDRGRLIITTTPAARSGIVFELYDRATAGELDDYHITKKTTREMNPRVSERVINRAFKRDARAAATEYEAEFAEPVAAFFDSESIDRAIDKHQKRVERGRDGFSYSMAIDPATMSDRYAFVVCHQDKGVLVLDHAQLLYPPVDHNEAEALVEDLAKRFHPTTIRCDTAATVIRMKSKLQQLEYVPFTRPTKLRIYGTLKEMLAMGNVVLYNDPELIAELRALQIKDNVDISAPKSGTVKHDDLSDCLALCADALAAGVGELVGMLNLFYGEYEGVDPNDFLRIGSHFSYAPGMNRNPHPPGITYENCPRRNRGCVACTNELELLGFYQAEEEAVQDIIPLSQEEADKQFIDNSGIGYRIKQQNMEVENESKVIRRFRQAVRRRLEGGDQSVKGS